MRGCRLDPKQIEARNFPVDFCTRNFWGGVIRYATAPLTVALSPGHSDTSRFRPWSPIAPATKLDIDPSHEPPFTNQSSSILSTVHTSRHPTLQHHNNYHRYVQSLSFLHPPTYKSRLTNQLFWTEFIPTTSMPPRATKISLPHNDTLPTHTSTIPLTTHLTDHFTTMKEPNTSTRTAIIKYNSALHNTTLHTKFLLQDRKPQAVKRSLLSWWWA